MRQAPPNLHTMRATVPLESGLTLGQIRVTVPWIMIKITMRVHRRRQIVFGKYRATPIGAISIFLTVSSLFAVFADP